MVAIVRSSSSFSLPSVTETLLSLPTTRSACEISGKLEWKVALRDSGSLGFLRYRAENRPQRGEPHTG